MAYVFVGAGQLAAAAPNAAPFANNEAVTASRDDLQARLGMETPSKQPTVPELQTFEVEGAEFHNPLGTGEAAVPPGDDGGATVRVVRTTTVDTTASPGSSVPALASENGGASPRSPGDDSVRPGTHRRRFKLNITTTDAELLPYFPDGAPRKFPEGQAGRVAATSYDELNGLIAKNLTLMEERGIYILCTKKDADNSDVHLDPYGESDKEKEELFRAVPAVGTVKIFLKKAETSVDGAGAVPGSPTSGAGGAVKYMNFLGDQTSKLTDIVESAVEKTGEIAIEGLTYGGEHHNKRRRGLYKIKCAGRRHREPLGRCLVHPLSPVRVLWDIVQGFIVVYLFFYLPFQLAFAHDDELEQKMRDEMQSTMTVVELPDDNTTLAGRMVTSRLASFLGIDTIGATEYATPSLDTFIDWMIVMDFFLQFRTAYSLAHNDETTEIVTSSKKIFAYRVFGRSMNYIPSSSFVVSLITAMPLDKWAYMYLGYGHRNAAYFRAVKCLRVERMKHTMPFFDAFVERWTVVIPALKPMASLLSTLVFAIALCHIMSCLLYLAGHPMWEEQVRKRSVLCDAI